MKPKYNRTVLAVNSKTNPKLKSPSAINDAFNITKHEMMVDIIKSVINFVESKVMHENEEI